MPTLHDDDLRDLLAPLKADDEPTRAEIAEVRLLAARRSADHTGGGRRRRALRIAAPAGALALTAAAALAFLPGGGSDAGIDGPSLLRAAAAAAAEQPATSLTGYRHTSWFERWSAPADPQFLNGRTHVEQRVQHWVDGDARGRTVRGEPTFLADDRETPQWRATWKASDGAFLAGDAWPRLDLDTLPSDPAAVRRRFDERAHQAVANPSDAYLTDVATRDIIDCLALPAARPAVRAALWGALALSPGVRALGEREDAVGRTGEAVLLPARSDGRDSTVVWDPARGDLLEWSQVGGDGTPSQSHTLLAAEQVPALP